MNLRTHTYLIPALCGGVAFSLLVVADYSFRRYVNGPGYGLAAYYLDVRDHPGRRLPELADAAEAAKFVEVREPAQPAVAAVQPALPKPEAAVVETPAPAEPAPVAVEAAAPEAETPAPAVIEAAGGTPEVVSVAVEDEGFRPQCFDDKGFKRCRVRD